ncbi:hypothetical protein D3C71_1643780 [compost metagenome]
MLFHAHGITLDIGTVRMFIPTGGLYNCSNGMRILCSSLTGPLHQASIGIVLISIPCNVASGIRVLGRKVEALELPLLNALTISYPANLIPLNGNIPSGCSLILFKLGTCWNS